MKKRRKYGYYFLICEGIAIIAAAILIYFFCDVLYYNYSARLKDEEMHMLNTIAARALASDGNTSYADEQSFYNQLGFKCAVNSEIENGIRYSWIEDADTGEILTDSDRKAILFIREQEDGPMAVYTCDMDHMKEFWEKYDCSIYYEKRPIVVDFNNMDALPVTLVSDISKALNLYNYEIKDVYIKDHSFIVGTMDIRNEDLDTNVGDVIATYTALSEEISNYRHIDEKEYDTYKTKIFISVGGVSDINKEEVKKQLGNNGYYITMENSPFPGKIWMVSKKDVVDMYGRNLAIYQTLDCEFSYDCVLYITAICIIIGLVALVVGLLVAKWRYDENKRFCDMYEYRKCLMDSMAHDLKSPLAIMGGYAQNLAEDVNSEKRMYYADSIIKNVDYMNKIISNNLELSKLDMTEVGKQKETVDLVIKIKELFETYNPALSERKVKLTVEGEYKRKVNPKNIDVALENVVSNAVKYANNNGEIKVFVKGKQLIISNTTKEAYDGKIEKLWEPFVKGDKSRGNEKGTGLGLSIAKRIFEMNNLKAILKSDNDNKVFCVIIS